jgi:hypothetical protein
MDFIDGEIQLNYFVQKEGSCVRVIVWVWDMERFSLGRVE